VVKREHVEVLLGFGNVLLANLSRFVSRWTTAKNHRKVMMKNTRPELRAINTRRRSVEPHQPFEKQLLEIPAAVDERCYFNAQRTE